MNKGERALHDWALAEFRLNYGQLSALAAILSGYRLFECPMTRDAIIDTLERVRPSGIRDALLVLEQRGFIARAWKVGASCNQTTWVPTPRALTRFPEPEPEPEKSSPGIANIRVGRKRGLERMVG